MILQQNLHNHTKWSDGEGEVDEVIEKAIAGQLEMIAITDHFSRQFGGSGKMNVGQLDGYREEVWKIRRKYEKYITVLAGIEVSTTPEGIWLPNLLEDTPIIERFSYFDVVVMEHVQDEQYEQFRQQRGALNKLKKTQILPLSKPKVPEFVQYIAELREKGMKSEVIIPHSDLPTNFSLEDMETLARNNIMIEVNSRAPIGPEEDLFFNKPGYLDLLNHFTHNGGMITLASDAHLLADVCNIGSAQKYVVENDLQGSLFSWQTSE